MDDHLRARMHEAVTIFDHAIDEVKDALVKAAQSNTDRPTLPLNADEWEMCFTSHYDEDIQPPDGDDWWLVAPVGEAPNPPHGVGYSCLLWARKRKGGE